MLRRLFIPLLLPILIFAAFVGWHWYQIHRAMEALAAKVAPFASLQYQIPISYKGEYRVTDLVFDVMDSGIPIRIREAKLEVDDWQHMLLLGTPFQQDEFPDQMELSLSGVTFDSQARADQRRLMAIMLEQPLMEGCVKANGQSLVLRDLGLGELNSSVDVGYTFNPESQVVNVELAFLVANVGSVTGKLDFDAKMAKLNKRALEAYPPQLLGIAVDSQDQGYNKRLTQACAESQGITPTDFINQQVDLLAKQVALTGIQVPEQVYQLYRELFLPGAQMRMAVDFKTPMPLAAAGPEMLSGDWLENLDVSMQVNQKKVDMPGLILAMTQALNADPSGMQAPPPTAFNTPRVDVPPPLPARPAAPAASLPKPLVEEAPPAVEPEVVQPVYQTVSGGQINASLVGLEMRADTFNGNDVEGEILQVGNDRLIVRQKIGTGSAEIPLLLKNTRRIQVLR